ncbi:OLC1v1033915C1 [Oldenlandia corymbosa var. corymbosa]|uniref:OLC1v1033915C1 n=1 Tax=Oldenlandia corymbosa var. corymbosa TaxID=529605 RepID=A0AAV1CSI7_OLDCO|nr:OLC1v1033915C1 [Oldenlandia corymbosa var. corymbosa]
MDDGGGGGDSWSLNGTTTTITQPTSFSYGATCEASVITQELSMLSLPENGESFGQVPKKTEKDPRIIARRYQTELCKKATEENVIVCLGTGCGKTHIAVLLIFEMASFIRKPQKNICIFLAPTVALVQQQAKVIEDSLDFKVGVYCGNAKRPTSHHDWEKEMEDHEILVMTPQILLHNLNHSFIKIELIALLIFDECHYAQPGSNHPYSEIMKVFYKCNLVKLPRIFGMTASPILGKGASLVGLETLLRAKVYSVEELELQHFVASPKLHVYYYNPVMNGSSAYAICHKKLEKIKHESVSALPRNIGDHDTLRSTKKMLQRLHGNILFCMEHVGLWGALQASRIFLKGDQYEGDELSEVEENADCSICDQYLTQAKSILASACREDGNEPDLSLVEVLKEPFFSSKLLRLIGILRDFRLQPNLKCIVFVNRIVTARTLSYILKNLKFLSSWKCDYLLGVHSGLKSRSRKNTNVILEKFRSSELNLLIATKVGEEGLDIQTCCLVIRFDLPETVASFIQSRGRARMPQSEYAFLVNRCSLEANLPGLIWSLNCFLTVGIFIFFFCCSYSENERNLIKHFRNDESKINTEISSRKSQFTMIDFEEKTYQVDSTGATISSASSVSLLHRYCSKLWHDEYFYPKPQFFYMDDKEGMICHIVLPSNAPFREIVSDPQPSFEVAKKDACLKACKALHEVGALTDHLLPEEYNECDEVDDDFSDLEIFDDDDSRKELHEMLIPAAFREKWNALDNCVSLRVYHFKFCPNPVDRVYKNFALFVKASLPEEAEKMKLDLHLDRGRSVSTELVPSGVVDFEKDELVEAEKFQRMFLKIILDRAELSANFVSLEDKVTCNSFSSTSYLLLPVLFNEKNKISVDWKVVRRCLLSPIFRAPECAEDPEVSQFKRQLQLANGIKSEEDVLNSLVYVPCRDTFFFVSDIVFDKNGYSLIKDVKNHVQHYLDKFNISLKFPHQPLLKAKQLFCLDNLLRKKGYSEQREKEEHMIELPPEICQLKVVGFSKDIGSSLSLLPSIMHRLEGLLVATELKNKLSASFPEGAEITVDHVLEALTTEKCNEHFSLERFEVLGDAFLKFAVARHLFLLHDSLDEGQLTRKRSKMVNNSNLLYLATKKNLQVYIRDQSFEPKDFFALGRPCPVICSKETEKEIHSVHGSKANGENAEVRCSRCHHWLHKKTIADVLESLVGAFLVDSGFKGATAFLKWIGIEIDCEDSRCCNICSSSSIFLPLANHEKMDLSALESLLDYQFTHKGLLIQAFIHPSYNNHSGGCYQRLEFLGDAVLDYLITSYLFSVYPKLKPGQLTDLRSASVNNTSIAEIAIRYSFHKFIICDSSELSKAIEKYVRFTQTAEKGEADDPTCPKALGDLVESCMGAILLDSGFNLERVWRIMLSFLNPNMSFSKLWINPVRDLRELCQCHNLDLQFSSSKRNGRFSVQAKVKLGDNYVQDSAVHVSKKSAQRMASKLLYSQLKDQGLRSKSKSLEEVLKETKKMTAQLIGYDEVPWDVTAKLQDLKLQDVKGTDFDRKVHPLNEVNRNNGDDSHKLIRRRDIGVTKNQVRHVITQGKGICSLSYVSSIRNCSFLT